MLLCGMSTGCEFVINFSLSKTFRSVPVKFMCVGKAECNDPCIFQKCMARSVLNDAPVANAGNVLPYRDQLASGEWVINFLQRRKLAFACASAEVVKVGKIVRRLLHNLETWEHEEEHALVQGHMVSCHRN